MIGRLRVLLYLDSAICLVSGAAVTAFASPLAEDLSVDSSIAVRSVGVFLVGYGIVLALLARAAPETVEVAGRLTALADASWLLATVALVGADAFSFGGDIAMSAAAIPVTALGVGKTVALRSQTPDPGRGPQAHQVVTAGENRRSRSRRNARARPRRVADGRAEECRHDLPEDCAVPARRVIRVGGVDLSLKQSPR